MSTLTHTLTYQKLLSLRPETIQWLNQRFNVSQTIDELVTTAQNSVREGSVAEEELEISREQINTLQQQLQEQIEMTETYRKNWECVEHELRTLAIQNSLSNQLNTVELIREYLKEVAQKFVLNERAKNGTLLIESKDRIIARLALNKFIAILLR